MTFRIVMENPGGELDARTAEDEFEAVTVLRAMVEGCGELHDGDVFRVIEDEEAA